MRSLLFAIGVLACCHFSIAAQDQMGTIRVQVRAAHVNEAAAIVSFLREHTSLS
jgi:hypothetical protein